MQLKQVSFLFPVSELDGVLLQYVAFPDKEKISDPIKSIMYINVHTSHGRWECICFVETGNRGMT